MTLVPAESNLPKIRLGPTNPLRGFMCSTDTMLILKLYTGFADPASSLTGSFADAPRSLCPVFGSPFTN
jgi:hypothetical protein